MNVPRVLVSRGAGGEVNVPVTALYDFQIRPNIHTDRPDERKPRYRLTALMSCAELPEGEPFGHSCLHGPPPHLIRVVVRPATLSRHGSRSQERMDRLRREIDVLAAVHRSVEEAA